MISYSQKHTIKEKVLSTFSGKEGKIFLRYEIIEMVLEVFPETNRNSIIPSDYCYNITNKGINFNFHAFELKSKGVYQYLGEGVQYNGLITWKGLEVGEWKNGKFRNF